MTGRHQRAHAHAAEEIDGHARLDQGAEEAGVGEGAGAAAAEDEADRASAQEARDAADVLGVAVAHVVMAVHAGGVEPGRACRMGARAGARVQQDEHACGGGAAGPDDGLERAKARRVASARATSTMRSACRTQRRDHSPASASATKTSASCAPSWPCSHSFR